MREKMAVAAAAAATLAFIWWRRRRPAPGWLVVVFSGKRKSGKDYVTDRLQALLGDEACEIIRCSAPLKRAYAEEHGLNYEELLTDGPYKEKYRADMIAWGERRRQADPGFFCRIICAAATRPVWIVSDARRPTDVEYFLTHYCCLTVRVEASLSVREQRGWKHTPGVDDAESECALDQWSEWAAAHGRPEWAAWGCTLVNEGDSTAQIAALAERVRAATAGL